MEYIYAVYGSIDYRRHVYSSTTSLRDVHDSVHDMNLINNLGAGYGFAGCLWDLYSSGDSLGYVYKGATRFLFFGMKKKSRPHEPKCRM